jgi:hypothetical protein
MTENLMVRNLAPATQQDVGARIDGLASGCQSGESVIGANSCAAPALGLCLRTQILGSGDSS